MRIEMRGEKVELRDDLREHIDRRLRFALGRIAGRIERLKVCLSDVNGPRGGIDKSCRISVALIPRGVVNAGGSGDDEFTLVSLAAKRAARAVRRVLDRRRRGRISRR